MLKILQSCLKNCGNVRGCEAFASLRGQDALTPMVGPRCVAAEAKNPRSHTAQDLLTPENLSPNNVSMIFRRLFLFAFAITATLQGADVTQTDHATAQWLSHLFTLEQGQLLIAKKPFDHVNKARFPFAGQTEIQLVGRDEIIVNQDSLHPLSIKSDHQHLTISLYTPMYDFLDDALDSDGLPSRVPHPKDSAMTAAGYRAIATHIHRHLTQITGELPEHHRTLDSIGYVSESYTWKIHDLYFYLWAYDGNDSDGIWFRISRSASDLHGSRAKPHTTKDVYKDWGAPLPHRPSQDPLSIPDDKDAEKAKRD